MGRILPVTRIELGACFLVVLTSRSKPIRVGSWQLLSLAPSSNVGECVEKAVTHLQLAYWKEPHL